MKIKGFVCLFCLLFGFGKAIKVANRMDQWAMAEDGGSHTRRPRGSVWRREDGCVGNDHRTWTLSGSKERNAAVGTPLFSVAIYKSWMELKSVLQ